MIISLRKSFKFPLLFLLAVCLFGKSYAQSVTYNYTGGIQTYTVPAGVTSLDLDVVGARGGGSYCTRGGYQSEGGCGGRVQATIAVTPGDVLQIIVGQRGSNTSGAAYGGGGRDLAYTTSWPAAGGGGASSVINATSTTTLAIAGGGGGGGGHYCSGWSGGIGDAGGAGGGLTGGAGNSGFCGAGQGGQGGTPLVGGTGISCSGFTGLSGTAGVGANATLAASGVGSGAGGGGYYGGGAGSAGAGGGGGSSYTDPVAATGVIHTQGYNCTVGGDIASNGLVIITPTCTAGTIAGPNIVCEGSTITLTDAVGGGTWSSTPVSVATISSTGVVTGIAAGMDTVTYTIGTCSTVYYVTVSTKPPPITGNARICVGSVTLLEVEDMSGVWVSSNLAVDTVDDIGNVYGVSVGTSTISFITAAGCFVTRVVTVNPVPAAISGPTTMCQGTTVTLSDAAAGGTWSSSTTSVATVTNGGTTSTVTGTGPGTATITYSTGAGATCYDTAIMTVTGIPGPILGIRSVCVGGTTILSDIVAGGTWTSGNLAIATIDSTGLVTAGASPGTTIITYATGCLPNATAVVTVTIMPTAILGLTNLCIGSGTTLTDAVTGGTWSSSNTAVATIGLTSGNVNSIAAGTTTISYTNACGTVTQDITVNPQPAAIAGTRILCSGTTTQLSDAVAGGTWASVNTGVATIDATGLVTGLSSGTSRISYIIGTCFVTAVVTVNAQPLPITGTLTICNLGITNLTDATAGGTWSSTNTGVATVNGTGRVTGISPGTTTISYTIGICYVTTVVTVNPQPVPITGTLTLCNLATTAITDATAGGTWTSANTGVATIDATGLVTGVSAGTSRISYTIGSCFVTAVVTVNVQPAPITGTLTLCNLATSNLTDAVASGTWTSINTSVATISVTGLVAGASAGTSTISYTIGSCFATTVVTVNPQPTTINGTRILCNFATTSLTDAIAGGTWMSVNTGVATIDAAGLVTGVSAGTSMISYAIGSCYVTAIVTINPQPAAITGTFTLCNLATTNLTDAVAGGTWNSANTSVATIGSSGLVTGVSAGTSMISYTIGSCFVTAIVTVNPQPAPITGVLSFCNLSTSSLTDATPGGTWTSVNTGVATVSGTGLVTGVSAGTSTISYTIGSCYATVIVTVNIQPEPITGTLTLCNLATTNLTDATTGGTWTSVNTGVATIGITGLVNGVSAGTSMISYTIGSCYVTAIVTVNPQPGPINGTRILCNLATTSLTDAVAGGTWTSVNPGVATISSSGLVTGVSAGTSIISYTIGTCYVTAIVTVNPQPVPITGALTLCNLATTNLTDVTAGGTWTSVNTGVATISATGLVTGVSAGTSMISYTIGSCFVTAIVTVNPQPAPIAGTLIFCNLSTTPLTDVVAGGSWTSVNTGVATISGTGLVTGVSVGTSMISYTIGSCYATALVTVSAMPTAITGTMNVCVGLTTTLGSIPGGGTWSTVAGTGTAGIGAGTGVVTGLTAGTATVSYSLGGLCNVAAVVTINPNPTVVTGNTPVCVGLTATLNSTPAGGTWSTSAGTGSVGIGAATGVITGATAGNAVVTYTLATGCYVTAVVTVNPNPTAITGNVPVCVGATATLNSTPAGGTWTTTTGTGSVGIGAGSGVITGLTAGTATVKYTLGTGCIITATVTINPNPTTVTGNTPVCVGLTATLNSTPAGGAWSTSAGTGSVGIGAATGIITGATAGNASVTYTLPTGCYVVATATVNPNPNAVTGNVPVCVGLSTTLGSTPAGGTWSASAGTGGVGIGAGTGVITGATAGTANVTYTLATGCIVTAIVTVNANPTPVTGNTPICVGLTATLNSTPAGGTWSTSAGSGSVGIGAGTGIITGNTAGNATVTYTLATGCITTAIVTVNPLPAAINGNLTICIGLTTSLTDASAGGTWSSSNGNATIAIPSSGVVTGVAGGTSVITYTLPTGCITTAVVTVNTLPVPIMGTLTVCSGSTTTLSDTPGGGVWSVGTGTGSITIAGSVTVTGVTAGTVNITYTIGTGCIMTAVVTVNPLPSAILGSPVVCPGASTLLSDVVTGGSWSGSNPAIGTISSGGLFTGIAPGTTTINYTLPTGCMITRVETVDPSPFAGVITGVLSLCQGTTTALTDAAPGGVWSSVNPGIASVSGSGLVSGVALGTTTISYTVTNSCGTVAATAVVTIDPLPVAGVIAGTFTVCPATTTLLTDAAGGGVWSSSPTGTATINAAGMVTGVAAGTATISYAVTNSCGTAIATAVVMVNPLPVAGTIAGTLIVCPGTSSALTDAALGGVWSSSAPGTVAISASGVITGISYGTSVITYSVTNGCGNAYTTTIASVNPAPAAGAIEGGPFVCAGTTITLTNPVAAGTGLWSPGAPAIADIGATSGIVTGFTTGTTIITYSVTNVCGTAIATKIITVHAAPAPILGPDKLCVGNTISLSDSVADGVWSSSNASVATVVPGVGVVPTGLVSGIATGTVTISYVIAPACLATKVVTVNPIGFVTTGGQLCVDATELAPAFPAGGTWSSSTPSVATVDPATGLVTGIESGVAIISYTLGAACIVQTPVTVNRLPANFYVIGGGSYCLGGSGASISLNGSDTGVSYSLYHGGSPLDSIIGTGSALDYGMMASSGIYSVLATNIGTGCTKWMGGTVTVNVTVPVPPFVTIFEDLGTTICSSSWVNFTAIPVNGGTAPTYVWYVNGVNAGTGATYGYVPANGDVVKVVLTSNAVCTAPDTAASSVTMTTSNNLVPAVTISTSPGDSVCPGTPVTFTPSTSFGGLTPGYTWRVNGIVQGSGSTFTYLPMGGDNILCFMTSSIACATPDSVPSNSIVIRVPAIEIPAVSLVALPGNTFALGDTVSFVASVGFTGIALTYEWQVNGTLIAGATADTFTTSSITSHDTVTVRVTGYSTCGSTAREATIIMVDTSTTGTGTGTLGTTNVSGIQDVKLIPNPNNGTFTLKGSLVKQQVIVSVTDMLGQVILRKEVGVQDGRINELIQLGGIISNGMYLLHLKGENESRTFHFVVER